MPSFHAKRVCECTPEDRERGLKWVNRRTGAIIAGVALGTMIISIAAAPAVIAGVGFGAAGIEAGSFAAAMMSSAALANGGGVAAGSLLAILQSIGAAGLGAGAAAVIGAAGAATGASISAAALLAQGHGEKLCRLCEGVLQSLKTTAEDTSDQRRPPLKVIDFQLLLAVEDDDLSDVEALLQAGADVHVRYVDGATLLHLAAAKNCMQILPRLLLEIDVNTPDSHECTALFYAVANDCEEAAQFLLEHCGIQAKL